VKCENEERERERKGRKAGGVVSRARLSRVPSKTKGRVVTR